mgnify:CR=1 FL=1
MKQMVNVGKMIEYLLCERNMTNRELAYRTGVTEVTIGRYIKGTREPNATNLANIADVLGVTTDYLLGNTQEPKGKGVSIPILGKVVAVLVNGQDATVKQIIKHDNGIFLHGFNQSVYTDAFYNNQQIEELPVIILGKVIESRRKF